MSRWFLCRDVPCVGVFLVCIPFVELVNGKKWSLCGGMCSLHGSLLF